MKTLWLSLLGLLVVVLTLTAMLIWYEEKVLIVSEEPGEMPFLETNQTDITANTTRVGSDDPVETAVAVAQVQYPVTEEENSPGAVVLINRNHLAEAMAAASRVQHFPVNAPLLYVDENSVPELTRKELLRLEPEGVPADANTQVYLIGTIGEAVQEEVQAMGYRTRLLTAPDPASLVEVLDNWSSTQHGDHKNNVVIANLDNLAPAIPSAFWNAHMGDGLAFVTNENIPEPTRRILERRANGPWIYVFGDETVISSNIARELARYGHVTRIPRPDIVGTSAYFAGFRDEGQDWGAWFWQHARSFGWGITEPGHNAIFVNIDGPAGWQNVIPATTMSHMGKHAPVLAVQQGSVPEAIRTYLNILKPYPTAPREQLLNHGWIIGGEETISWETQAELDILLDAYLEPAVAQTGQ